MVYLDYSSTTPVLKEVLDSFNKVSNEFIGNPNSLHSLGVESKKLMQSATKQIADLLNIKENEIIYTSGSTESNNLALIGSALNCKKKGMHIVTSKLEHESMYEICNYLEEQGFIIDYVKNDENGVIDFDDLSSLITNETYLVTIAAVNSEVGIRQPLKTIKQIINKNNPKCLFHSDMTQGLGKVPINLIDVDMATFDSQKIYGPKGIGILYKSEKVNIKPLFYGSKNDIRPGTPIVPLIASFSKALRIIMSNFDHNQSIVTKLNKKIIEEFKKYPNIMINNTSYSIPNIINISLMNIKPETFIHALEKYEIYVGSNTACASGKPSPTVYNLYKDKDRSLTTIRISLSHLTTEEEIDFFLKKFAKVYLELESLENE